MDEDQRRPAERIIRSPTRCRSPRTRTGKGMLFAGTGNGFYYSLDDGAHWTQFKEGLPAAPVTWIVVQKAWHDVVVSTYGRGLFILRDITPLEQRTKSTTRHVRVVSTRRVPASARRAAGPRRFLFQLPTARRGPVRVEILDSAGKVIRTFTMPTRAGLNRATWDLRYDAPRKWRCARRRRTTRTSGRSRASGTRRRVRSALGDPAAPAIGARSRRPGSYTVRVTDGRPNADAAVARFMKDSGDRDHRTPTCWRRRAMQVRIRDDMNAAADMINQLEVDAEADRGSDQGEAGKRRSSRSSDAISTRRCIDVELQLLSRTDLHSDDKWYVERVQGLHESDLAERSCRYGAGDVAGGADYRPTDASVAVLEMIEKDLTEAKTAFSALVEKEIPAANRALSGKGIPTIGVVTM